MGKYFETKTVLIRVLIQDKVQDTYRYLRLVELDDSDRGFQEKYPYVVEEYGRKWFFFNTWKPLVVKHFFNFTEAKHEFSKMFEQALLYYGEPDTSHVTLVSIDFNPERFYE